MTNFTQPAGAKIRYYDDAGLVNRAMQLPELEPVIHKLLCRWTRLNYHCRDFVTAVEFEAMGVYTDYLLAGSPPLVDFGPVPGLEKALAECLPVPKTTAVGPVHRFYDDEGHLNGAVDLRGIRAALLPFFFHGLSENWNMRDFIALAKDAAVSAIYDMSISSSMGGLGGCRTLEEYLSSYA